MFDTLKTLLARLHKDEKGVTLVEYGIALILAIVVGTTLLQALAGEVAENVVDAEAALAAGSNTYTRD